MLEQRTYLDHQVTVSWVFYHGGQGTVKQWIDILL